MQIPFVEGRVQGCATTPGNFNNRQAGMKLRVFATAAAVGGWDHATQRNEQQTDSDILHTLSVTDHFQSKNSFLLCNPNVHYHVHQSPTLNSL